MHRLILKYDKKFTLMYLIKLQKKVSDVGFEPTPMRPDPKTARIAISFREPPLSAGENYLSDCDLTIRVAFTKMATKTRVFNQLPSNLYM